MTNPRWRLCCCAPSSRNFDIPAAAAVPRGVCQAGVSTGFFFRGSCRASSQVSLRHLDTNCISRPNRSDDGSELGLWQGSGSFFFTTPVAVAGGAVDVRIWSGGGSRFLTPVMSAAGAAMDVRVWSGGGNIFFCVSTISTDAGPQSVSFFGFFTCSETDRGT